ncbi:hypothetical protein BaRGS_00012850 [Batillaria attramentaria]|uniref:Uncharacterized protein n=1 Tax=Batillaria attramentaria TaxID=370345 RepID=A0ABD0L941_9CAEN
MTTRLRETWDRYTEHRQALPYTPPPLSFCLPYPCFLRIIHAQARAHRLGIKGLWRVAPGVRPPLWRGFACNDPPSFGAGDHKLVVVRAERI